MILVRFTIDNRNRLVFYGNTVGYVKDDAAVVDEMFQTDEAVPLPGPAESDASVEGRRI